MVYHSAIKVPGIGHHQGEVLIVINRGANIVVVLFEFLACYDMVWRIIVAHSVGCVERFEELLENLLFSLLSRDEIGMFSSAVGPSNIVDVQIAISIFVHLSENPADISGSKCIHGSTDLPQELVVLNEAIAVCIKPSEKSVNLSLRKAKHVVCHRFGKFILVKGH